MNLLRTPVLFLVGVASLATVAVRAEKPGDPMLADYFRVETAAIETQASLAHVSLEEWKAKRDGYRAELLEMLGLAPLPARTPLQATITGTLEHDQFTVEKLHFQSSPGVYVTANLYVPKPRPVKAATVLYISGHSRVREGNVSFGSKVSYQHHGIWFAQHGFVCLVLDSTGELAEIEGNHHGAQRDGFWWWYARGYTPAGVETWNAMRALDYLETRPEVDARRIGVTGRSGGGVGSWWIAALDDRIKVAVPVAGMTDLRNQVVDGKAGRHCDCMFMVNTHRWDFARVGALIAPRPLLFSNSDKDDIFPLDGVERMHRDIAHLYALYGASEHLGLLITDGPHRDTQDLQVPAFRWMARFLRGEDLVVDQAAKKLFTPAQLKVFATLPADERNTRLDREFGPSAKPVLPADAAAWTAERDGWLHALRQTCFAGWPAAEPPLQLKAGQRQSDSALTFTSWSFVSQGPVSLPLYVYSNAASPAAQVHLVVLDELDWAGLSAVLEGGRPVPDGNRYRSLYDRAQRGEIALAFLAPRGIGPTEWSGNAHEQLQVRRRFMLLGQTVEGMRVWDVGRAAHALKDPQLFPTAAVYVSGARNAGINALYASLFTTTIAGLDLFEAPASHLTGPDYLAVLRILDVPQALVLAAERAPVRLHEARGDWSWSLQASQRLGWPADRLQVTP